MIVKDFKGQHKQCQMGKWEKTRLRAKLLAGLIDGKIYLLIDYSQIEIMEGLELELAITLSYMQSWLVRE